MKENIHYEDVKGDFTLFHKFNEAVKVLATGTGSLNDRLYKAYFDWIHSLHSNNFKEDSIKNALIYIEKLMYDKNKCHHFKHTGGGAFQCHWKQSQYIANNIFFEFLLKAQLKVYRNEQ